MDESLSIRVIFRRVWMRAKSDTMIEGERQQAATFTEKTYIQRLLGVVEGPRGPHC
jgi:hypothetical protein